MNIYFSGIGGVGIGPLAMIAHDAGYKIFGSDSTKSLTTDQLEKAGVEISFDQSGKNLADIHKQHHIDWLVHTAALPENHPELLFAKENNIKTSKRDELLSEIIKAHNLKLIAVAGTHGKTTTTGMIIWLLKQLKIPVSYSIGTTISFGPIGKFDPDSKYFVYECDEFDRNMLHFEPFLSIITNVSYDHSDTYPTKQDYDQAFKQFARQSQGVIGWKATAKMLEDQPNVTLLDEPHANPIKLAGEHNRQNAFLAMVGLLTYVPEVEEKQMLDLVEIFESFPGTDRRFEKLADGIYSDYGHHPEEIKATLQMAKEIAKKVVLIYQPHQNIRQHEIKDQYTDTMNLADQIFWLPTYLSREDPKLKILSPKELTEKLENKNVTFIDFDDQSWQKIIDTKTKDTILLFMGAGAIDGWARKHLEQ